MKSVLQFITFSFCLLLPIGAMAAEELVEVKKPVIEGEIGAGFMASQPFFISTSIIAPAETILPTGIIHARFGNGEWLRPEFRIEESGGFLFNRNGISKGSATQTYNSYYLKIPLGIAVPFFTYPSSLSIDGTYSVLRSNFKTKQQVVVNNIIRNPDEKFNALSTYFIVRLYLNTPISRNISIFEHSYFGVYYSERTYPRTATAGTTSATQIPLFIDTVTRSGGIFFDIKKDTLLKGLNFEIGAYVGYGEIEARNSASVVDAGYGNTDGLIAVLAKGTLNYRYVFSNDLGLKLTAGVEYYSDFEFFTSANLKKYSLNLQGDLKYFANLTFVFGY